MIILGSIILSLYLISMIMLVIGYSKVVEIKNDPTNNEITKHHSFSIIIPFRNEAKNLPALLKSLLKLKFPKEYFEVIFVDDESGDDSVTIISKVINDHTIQIKVIKNIRKSASPKKDAITQAIKISKFDWIITTDADCLLPENWLLSFNDFILINNPKMIVGPVKYVSKNSLINQYQQLDNFSLQTTTIGSFGLNHPILCNGANLVYKKEEFNTVSGYSENNHIASGDDIFLLEKFKLRNSKGVQFIKNRDSIVITASQESWKEIVNQRVRWASKTSKQKDVFTLLLGTIVFLTNLFVIVGFLVCILQIEFFSFFLAFFIIKMILDLFVLRRTSGFFRDKINIPYFLLNTFAYPSITVFVVLKSFLGNYHWKGRTFNSK